MFRRIRRLLKKEICPYCFEYFYVKDAPFRCSSPQNMCGPEFDKTYENAWKDSRKIGKVITLNGKFLDRFKHSVRCDKCHNQTYKRICPHCHMELPYTTGLYKNYIFAVIGTKDSGKSHYIAVLIDQIKRKLGPSLGLLLTEENDFTIDRYKNNFYAPIYQDGITINTTKSATVDNSVQLPMVFSIRVTGTGLFQKGKIKKYLTLVFFDTAGEDLESDDSMSKVNKYIYRSDGIILLIDPLQLISVRKLLPTNTPLPVLRSDASDASNILNRTSRLIQKGSQLKPNEKIKIPLAIAFSKFDAVLPLIDPQFQLHSASNHNTGFDIEDYEAINSEMVSLLDRWDGQHIIHMVQTRFAKSGFFGLTALGCNPHITSKIPSVQPNRVEDPFLWLLSRNRIIKKVKH